MKPTDRLRIELALMRYDFWLDLRGVRGRRRRELRSELRANLTEATTDVGVTQALFGIGSPKELAHAAEPADPSRPRWQQGLVWGGGAFTIVLVALLATSVAVVQTVQAAQVSHEVEVHVLPWLGTTFTAQHTSGAISAGIESPWALLVLPLLTFLLVAQPWRFLRRQQRAPASPVAAHTGTTARRDLR